MSAPDEEMALVGTSQDHPACEAGSATWVRPTQLHLGQVLAQRHDAKSEPESAENEESEVF